MKLSEYMSYDALGLAELVRNGEVTPSELAELAFAAIEATNGRLNAVIDLYQAEVEQALAQGLPSGPLRGVPFLVKDLSLSYAGKPTTMGSRLFSQWAAPIDSELMARYRRAGLVVVGRTNVPELGFSFTTEPRRYGPTRNPWHVDHSSGGSSGGSAAAVAARMVPAAHGNDAGGSLRVPASCCGLFALKPTRGRTPAGPMMGELVFGLAVEHALTRSVRDSAALLDVTAGEDAGAPYAAAPPTRAFLAEVSTPPGKLRIALADEAWNGAPVASDCREAVARAARLCSSLGHEVVPARPPLAWEEFRCAYYGLASAFVAHLFDVVCPHFGLVPLPDLVEPSNLAIAARGRAMRAVDLASALGVRDRISRGVGAFFEQFDLLLTPTLAVPPPLIGELDVNRAGLSGDQVLDRLFEVGPFTALFNLTGSPAMNVPCHRTQSGLPLGVQFAARTGNEATLLRLAGQLEQELRWAELAPEVVPSLVMLPEG
jgi:amidase